ncbi:MAG: hypothetical protein NWE96_12185 [Candidatus Bathyarchaeota archaeon]|nr:hypothetical protein [Candidatus Bathyarchaeota archaeon]
MSNFSQLEQKQVSSVVGQVQIALMNEIDHYQGKVNTWARMANIVTFVRNQETSFDTSSQAITSWVELGVNYMLVYNKAGKFLYGFGFNLTTYRNIGVPQSLLDEIYKNEVLWGVSSVENSVKGIISIPEGSLIVASSSIPKSTTDETNECTLVMARFIDSNVIALLSRTVQLPVTLTQYDEWQKVSSQRTAPVESVNTFSSPIDNNYIIGYYVIKDLKDQPAFMLGVTIPRSIYTQGIITVNYVDRLVIVSCVVFSVTVALFLEFMFLAKLSKLNNEVSNITQDNTPTKRLRTKGNDEIDTLTKSINGMLDKIEENTHKLQKAERFSAIGELATLMTSATHYRASPTQLFTLNAGLIPKQPTVK